MPNGYAVTPGTIAGNLTVTGSVLAVLQAMASSGQPELVHLASSGTVSGIGFNVDPRGTTRDDATKNAFAITFDGNTNLPGYTRTNPANGQKLVGVTIAELLNVNAVANTGNVTENTIFTTILRGGSMRQAGQLMASFYVSTTVQGAGNSVVRFYLGGTALLAFNVASVAERWFDVSITNQSAQNVQQFITRVLTNGVVPGISAGSAAVDTSVDQSLSVTIQNANVGDSHLARMVSGIVIPSVGGF